MTTSQCPRCKKSKPVMRQEEPLVTYCYCEGCLTGWSVDKRDPAAELISSSRNTSKRP